MSIQQLAKLLFWGCCVLVLWGTLSTPSGIAASFPFQDKLLHVGAFATLAWTGYLGYPNRLLIIAVGLVGFGAGIEIVQAYVPARSTEFADLLADVVGIIIGLAATRPVTLWLSD